MNKQTKALTLIDILKIQHQCDETGEMVAVSRQALDEAITKLEALEQPAQEPVAWLYEHKHNNVMYVDEDLTAKDSDSWNIFPLYTHPAPSWQGLSDDEVQEVFNLGHKTFKEFARAIEQALKEKNT